jgi:cation:H+ antiporter
MAAFASLLVTAAGFVLLIVGAEVLVRGSASLARRLAMAEIAIGLTVVAFGTSTPEMVVNIFASAGGRNEIVFGNAIGSNIFNLLLILGVSGLIYPVAVQRSTVWKEIPFSLLATLVLLLLVNDIWEAGGSADVLSRNDGLILLLLFTIFITYTFGLTAVESSDKFSVKVYSWGRSLALIAGGLALLAAGGRLCVSGGVSLARQSDLSEKFIASTIMAAGTSLPELATSAVAAYRRHSDIAVGNIVGSNVFNILAILGVSAVIRPAPYPAAFNVDMSILIAATLLLFVVMFTGRRHTLDRWEAGLMLLGYVGYVGYLMYGR